MQELLSAIRFRVERELALRILRSKHLIRYFGASKVMTPAPAGLDYVLDPQVVLALALSRRMGIKPTHLQTLSEARQTLDRSAKGIAPREIAMATTPLSLAGRPARLYRPHGLGNLAPALLFVHGGGYVLGSTEGYDRTLRALAAAGQFAVVSIDYRLSPEHKYPRALEDVSAAFLEVLQRAPHWGLDRNRIALGGDSAGGTLTTVTCMDHRANALALPKLQLLLYPATDMGRLSPSREALAHGYFLEEPSIQWFLEQYLDDVAAQTPDPRVSPLRAAREALVGLPPAVIVLAGFDPLRDEGLAYARALEQAGVKTTLRLDEGMFHGYLATSGAIDVAREALAWTAREVARGLAA